MLKNFGKENILCSKNLRLALTKYFIFAIQIIIHKLNSHSFEKTPPHHHCSDFPG